MIATLLLVLALGATATNILLVQADREGIGKFINIAIHPVGSGSVTLLKLSNMDTFDSPYSDANGTLVKVGAGTIRLTAKPNEGYVFYYWTVDGDTQNVNDPVLEFKTSKGVTDVVAVFVPKTYFITATAYGPGTITTVYNGVSYAGNFTVEVEHGGESPTFEFAPTDPSLYHITSIKVDNNYTSYTPSYAFPNGITSDHDIVVTFDDIGVATVPGDDNVVSFIDSIVSVMFNQTGGGTLFGIALPFPEGTSLFLYEITTDATDADGWILLAMQLNGLTLVNVTIGETADAVYSDVNFDYQVDGTDVSLVANAIKETNGQPEKYDENFDVDRNGVLDERDVLTVNENKGATLIAPEWRIVGGTLYIFIENNNWSCHRAW